MSYTANAEIMRQTLNLATSYLDDEQADSVTLLFAIWAPKTA